MKKTIKKLLQNLNENAPPIDFETYSAKDYMTYILSLERKKGDGAKRLSIASYCNHRSALFHLYRMYGKKQPEQFVRELSILLKGLKRLIALEKQSGDGRIQSGKLPLTYSMYRRLNELMLMESSTEYIFAQYFMCLIWNLM